VFLKEKLGTDVEDEAPNDPNPALFSLREAKGDEAVPLVELLPNPVVCPEEAKVPNALPVVVVEEGTAVEGEPKLD